MDLEPSAKTIQDIEVLILQADESVLAHSVRAALTPFEQGPVKPTIISEENLKPLVALYFRSCSKDLDSYRKALRRACGGRDAHRKAERRKGAEVLVQAAPSSSFALSLGEIHVD